MKLRRKPDILFTLSVLVIAGVVVTAALQLTDVRPPSGEPEAAQGTGSAAMLKNNSVFFHSSPKAST